MHRARSFNRLPSLDEAMSTFATTPCLAPPSPTERPLYLYGAGNLGRLAREFLTTVGQEAAGIFERGDPVPETNARIAVSVITSPYVAIEHSLAARGCGDVVPFYDVAEGLRGRHPLANGWFADPLDATDQREIEGVHAGWDDDVSRAHHLQFIAWRRLREEWMFENAPVSTERYFIPEITACLHDRETFLDGGAHHGAVSLVFAAKIASLRVIAVEPDAANRALLRETLHELPGSVVLDCALAAEDGTAAFSEGYGFASKLSAFGQAQVSARSIDSLDIEPTFIKLHLEGGELDALRGARDTLHAHRPIVTATVYHNADGLWRTAAWLMRELDDYRFLFRNHCWCAAGAVVYAIPKERRQ
jgi:FkbM family methyltransferase